MYKHILIATDGSELVQRAVTHGLTLAKSVGAQASFVTATKMWSAMEMTGQSLCATPRRATKFGRRKLDTRGITTVMRRISSPETLQPIEGNIGNS